MKNCTIGLLPLYLQLYDDSNADKRPRIEEFYTTIGAELAKRGVKVLATDICRQAKEFSAAVKDFENEGAEAIVTLHLAYSPSLESAAALAATELPIVICDTTPTYSMAPDQDPGEIFYNHGIHGVQDMANLLIRNGKSFFIEAGHWKHSDVLDRVVARLTAVKMAAKMKSARVGLVGESFKGMGDFYTPADKLERSLGAKVVALAPGGFGKYLDQVDDAAVAAEMQADKDRFTIANCPEESHARSVKVQLAVDRWCAAEDLDAFTYNFLDVTHAGGFPTVPFMAASKLMARGIGFAGEGDVLTAAFVAALAEGDGACSFSEMFCPDWEHERIFLSHMGEVNYTLLAGKGLIAERPYDFSDTGTPAVLSGRLKGGSFYIANLAPLPDENYRLILAPAKMLEVTGKDAMEETVRGWFKPPVPVANFLAEYSRLGGTHHLAVVYKPGREALVSFGELMGWDVREIG